MPIQQLGSPVSCYYRALPRLIPQLLLMSRPNSEVILVSPWLDDITLHPPLFGNHTRLTLSLGQMIADLAVNYRIRFVILYRERDYRMERVIRLIAKQSPQSLILREVRNLHAKMVVIDSFALEMSANLLPTSLFRNVESCVLVANDYRNARRYVENKLGLII